MIHIDIPIDDLNAGVDDVDVNDKDRDLGIAGIAKHIGVDAIDVITDTDDIIEKYTCIYIVI